MTKYDPRKFQSTPSARRATGRLPDRQDPRRISIHALREESDALADEQIAAINEFQSTPSARRATGRTSAYLPSDPYFNPRPPRGERPWLVSGDVFAVVFQSTPSARRATVQKLRRDSAKRIFQSTPSARRATARTSNIHLHRSISIHALREESDNPPKFFQTPFWDFNPRPPRGERQAADIRVQGVGVISIHALREESDGSRTCQRPTGSPISIHALREESDVPGQLMIGG